MAFLVLPMPGLSAPLSTRIDQEKRSRSSTTRRRRACSARRSSASARASTRCRARSRPPSGGSTSVQSSLDRQKASCSPSATASRRRATGSSGCAASWRTARTVLAARLVEIYKADSPDALTVILESDGFGDLLERAEFLDRISDQDRADHRPRARAARQGAQPGRRSSPTSRSRSSSPPSGSSRERDQIAVGREPARRRARPARLGARRASAARSRRCARAAWRWRATSPRSRRSRRASRPPSRARADLGGPVKQGSGQLELAGQRPGRLALRHALGPPARRHRHRGAVRARRSTRRTPVASS